MFNKKVFLKFFAKLTGKCVGEGLKLYKERDSGTGILLFLRNFLEHLTEHFRVPYPFTCWSFSSLFMFFVLIIK